ncbi:alpha/beta hydrolase family protein [Paenibacillus caui]|uniref:alpha/beta hydrolase family protein n=1 Tax=Paenibacillus caui TaxID=2873927 RepID=UPI001CA9B36F|nr:alpha/beta hydrolase [Paenibacillus caui]
MPTDFILPLKGNNLLRCTRFQASGKAESLILIAHGYKGFKDWGMFPYAAGKLSGKHEVVTFNFSHNGIGDNPQQFTELDKFAVNTYEQEQQDLDALVSFLRKDPELSGLPLFLIGHSRGAGTSLVYALDHPDLIAGVISWNGVAGLDLFTPEQKQEMREQGISYVKNARTGQDMPLKRIILDDLERQRERYDIVGRLRASSFPVALIQGTNDGKYLQEGSARIVAARPDIPWIRIEGGNHTFNTVHPFGGTSTQLEQAIQASLDFIDKHLS